MGLWREDCMRANRGEEREEFSGTKEAMEVVQKLKKATSSEIYRSVLPCSYWSGSRIISGFKLH